MNPDDIARMKRPSLIDRMAYEAAGRGAYFDCDREWLYRFAAMLAEECAKTAEMVKVPEDSDGELWAGEAIRARFCRERAGDPVP